MRHYLYAERRTSNTERWQWINAERRTSNAEREK